jgi:spore germination cell wall hydrolase CwlJ-like protein
MLELIYLLQLLSIPSLVDTHCLATNIYHEARGESHIAQIAIGNVVLNRVKHEKYPNTVCGVVYQTKDNPIRLNRCQFSWYCDGISDRVFNRELFTEISITSFLILLGWYEDNTKGATHYYNPMIASPEWAKRYDYMVSHDNHDFYMRTD